MEQLPIKCYNQNGVNLKAKLMNVLTMTVMYCELYTVSYKQCATLLWTVTSVPLDDLLQFLYQWKQERIFHSLLTEYS